MEETRKDVSSKLRLFMPAETLWYLALRTRGGRCVLTLSLGSTSPYSFIRVISKFNAYETEEGGVWGPG